MKWQPWKGSAVSALNRRVRRTAPDRVLHVVGAIILSFYTAFFAWWLDELSARRGDKKFAQDLEWDLGTLTSKHRLRIVANDRKDYKQKRSFDLAKVTISGEEFRLQFIRIRGELSVYVQPRNLKRGWENVETTLGRIADPKAFGLQSSWSSSDVWKVGQFLDQNWERLAEAMSEAAPAGAV